MGKIMAGY